jgi:rRNA-processing protein FCF1
VLLIDTANVMGSRPTGWWRDRAGAARQLVDRVRKAAANSRLPQPVVMVLEGQARQGVAEGLAGGVQIIHAPRGGDDTLAALAEAGGEGVILVSADRALGERIRRVGGEVVGPNWLLTRLDPEP